MLDGAVKTVLTKMCEFVGADYDKIDFSSNRWFQDYKWTQEEEIAFAKWFEDYLYENSQARKELMTITTKNKRNIRQAVQMFLFTYGWSYER